MIPYLTVEHVSAIADVGVALAAAFAAWQGVKSLSAWRREKVGGRKMELAEEALVQFYQIEQAFNEIRSPIGDASEHADRGSETGESQIQKFNRDLGHTVWKRMTNHKDLFSEFYKTGLKLRALFGDEAYSSCLEIRKCFGEVRVGAQMLFRTPYEGYRDPIFQSKLEAFIWNMESEDSSSVEVRVRQSVLKAEKLLSPHLV